METRRKKNKKTILAIHVFQICEMISETYVQKLGRKELLEKDHFFIWGQKNTFQWPKVVVVAISS